MNQGTSPLLIVTDLDGSLLDHYTYDFAPAVPALEKLAREGAAVVLCSSKTRSEIQPIQHRLHLNNPYIVENGAAIYLPKSLYPQGPAGALDKGDEWCFQFGEPRDHWQTMLRELPDELRASYRRFSAMTPGQIADLTGLSLTEATRASRREFGEPLQWRGSEALKARFIEVLEAQGATVLQGGRFLHVGGDWDKGRALTWVASFLEQDGGSRPLTVALGDSQNDSAMLDVADHAIVIRSPVHPPPELTRSDNVYITRGTGPEGWAEGIWHVLKVTGRD